MVSPVSKPLRVEVVSGISRVPATAWDSLTRSDDPFTEYGFLYALEESGSASPETGWTPAHVLVRRGDVLVGAAPLYIKTHSYGEYIFDWAWAEASMQAGIRYYPKLVAAVPFTPVTGQRLLTGTSDPDPEIVDGLLTGIQRVADAVKASSIHLLFTSQGEHDALAGRAGYISRRTHQYHWTNAGYSSFEDWLSMFRSRPRKEARRERRRAAESGARLRVLRGPQLEDGHWRAIERFYRNTVARKHAHAYLQPAFFELIRQHHAERVVAFVAEVDDELVASALAFQRGQHLYGRYWGCQPDFRHLHFELCYHRPIELCIAEGWQRFEAGAQGPHKIKRGLLPAPTWSTHWVRHPGLASAVRDAVSRESQETVRHEQLLSEHGPFRRVIRER